MKKILSKVLIAISVFNGVNVSTGAMEENTEQPVNIQTGSNSWKEWAKDERKRINDLVDKLIKKEWENRFCCLVDRFESKEKSDSIDKKVAGAFTNLFLKESDANLPELPESLADYRNPTNDYEKYFEIFSLPYMIYGRGLCRNLAAWVLRYFFHSNIFARIVCLREIDSKKPDNKDLNHVVVLYKMPDENSENKWNYYIADLMSLKCCFNSLLNGLPDPSYALIIDWIQTGRDKCMQIPLKTYLNSKEKWCGVGFIIEFVPDKGERKGPTDPLYAAFDCNEGKISKEEASKRGVTDLTMWCEKNCPDVLK